MTSLKDKRSELLDDLLKGYDGDPKAILGEGGLLKDLTKSLVERAGRRDDRAVRLSAGDPQSYLYHQCD